ncbi:hypothetical protein FS935_02010 [Metabacillus litoralis]|uniref:Uncharacterized protein n=1 Tax=Metabacillus litoralis TaxID=152268 RepID=A0A5C6WAY9_9BACI|nr:CBO0543 family protein [Metabacillus litoralis]TXC92992.1 hypothetical protein FS935_02010 [Metabacillus litoralis]
MSEAVREAIQLNHYHLSAWYPLLTIFGYILILSYKKTMNLTKLEIYVSSLFALYLSIITDYLLGMTFNFYDYYDTGGDIWTPITVIPLYILTNIVFLNYYPFHSSTLKKCLYIFIWCVYAIAWEWFAVTYTSFFNYKKWELWYSAFIYPFLYFLLLANIKLIRRLDRKRF